MASDPALPTVRRLAGLPRSAWLYDRSPSGSLILAGPGVEEFPSGIFEGCWSGAFCAADFATAGNVFGSGLCVHETGIRFVTPSHVQNELFVWLAHDGEIVSNSLSFLLEHRGIELPYADWGRRFSAASAGIDSDYRLLHRSEAGRLLRIIHDDFEIDDGRIESFRPAPGPAFAAFADYRAYLREQLGLAIANGRDPARQRRLRAVAMASNGYDSVAAMALAAEFGLDAVLTLSKARDGEDDSGRRPAGELGFTVVERDFATGSASMEVEAEFIATGCGGEDVQLAAFADELQDAMLINGFHGDVVWGLTGVPDTMLTKKDRSGTSMGEFCLRIGATLIAVPLIGARRSPEIRRISLSEEMAPWRIGGSYDRPVPRRIAEEAGVSRASFGLEKRATSQLVFSSASFLSPDSLQDFRAKEPAIVGRDWRRYRQAILLHELRCDIFRRTRPAFDKRLRTARLGAWFRKALLGDFEAFMHSHPRFSDALFLWALGHQKRVYRRALEPLTRAGGVRSGDRIPPAAPAESSGSIVGQG